MVILMYHELERLGRELCDTAPGYTRYVVKEADFQAQLGRLKEAGTFGISLSQALAGQSGVTLTFDDGPESDLLIAAPALRAAGFGATFYIVAGWVGKKGFMTEGQLCELSGGDLEIGSHGMTHAFMSDLPETEMLAELADSKARLEDIVQKPVAHFSCPGGRWDERVSRVASELGYQTVATSRPGTGDMNSGRYQLPRIVIGQSTTLEEFDRLSRGEFSGRERAKHQLLAVAKSTLGSGVYQSLRDRLLGGRS